MPNSADGREALLQGSLELANREGSGLVERAIAGATKSLMQAATGAAGGGERARIGDAAEALHRAGRVISEAFPPFLREEVGASATGGPEPGKAFSFDSLELMGDDQVDDTVELVRGQQAIQAVVEPELVQLNALVSALQAHELVHAASNPLRPQVWVKALHRSLGRSGSPANVRALWMQHLCPAFAPELAALYRRICGELLQQGVTAAAYGVSAPQHESRKRAEAARLTLRDLKRLLVSASRREDDTQGVTRPAGQTMNGMTVPAAMVALEGMNHLDDVVRRMQARWRSGVWHAEKAGAEAGVAEYTPTQTLAREVVHLMVENISSDPRLLPDIQSVIRKLEPPLLHLAMNDQRFFTDRGHPARALLEEITQRSLAWPRPDAPGFAEFIMPLHEAAQLLSGLTVQDAEPFEFALHTLRQSWTDAEERPRRQRASVARALIQADARNHAAASIAARLRERLDVGSAPPDVRRFLLGPWSQVLAAAKLASPDAEDPGRYEALIGDIVWSSQPRLAVQNPARLGNIASTLTARMREALSGIGASSTDVEPFLASLAAAHARALRGEAGEDAASATHTQAEMVDWNADALPWLTPQEVQESQLMQATDFSPTLREEPAAQASADLATGQYIEVMVRGAWARWRLVWASPHGTMLMFTDAGGTPQSVAAAALRKMFDSGSARMLPGGSVIDSALDAVAQAALENSSQQPQSPM